jgi:protein-disulfide isomerase
MEEGKVLTKKERRALAKARKQKDRKKKKLTKGLRNWTIGLLLTIGLFFAGYKAWKWIITPPPETEGILKVTSEDWIKGNPDAVDTLIEYSDFQCLACAEYAPIIRSLADELGGHLRIIYRHFPLVSSHKNAFNAATAAEAAGVQGKFWEMHDTLFENQSEWEGDASPEDKFVGYAKELGIDEGKFKEDYKSDAVDSKVESDLTSANRLRLNRTPTFFFNGERVNLPPSVEEFKKLFE